MSDKPTADQPASAFRECLLLSQRMLDFRWSAPAMLALGAGAALAETAGITFAVMFLFVLLGQTERLMAGEGILGEVFRWFGGVLGAEPFLIATLFFALILANALLIYAYQVITAVMLNRVAERMRDMVHRQYVTVGYAYLQKREQGELVQTLATNTWVASEAFYALARMAINLCTVGIFGVGIFALSWEIGLIAAASAVLAFFMLRLLAKPIRRYGEETLAANRILAERMLVSLHGMRTLRAFAQEEFLLRTFGAASSKVRKLAIRKEKLKSLIGPLGEVISLGTLIVIAVIAGAVGVGVPTIIASVLLLFRLQPHLRELESNRLALAGMGAELRDVREVLAPDDKRRPAEGVQRFDGLHREIRFENVSFRHAESARASLSRISFVIPRGSRTLVTGPSGSGKTTLVNLLLRLYEPTSGTILVDGADLNRLLRADWLRRLAVSGQDVDLIEGTIAQNLKLADRDATIEEMREICAAVEILPDIEAAPGGFDARIGAHGLNFSGGQRQRICLARALLRRPEFLILDEAMSALEPEMEERIMARISSMIGEGTILFMSHRADAEKMADHVIPLTSGEICA